MGNSRVNQGRVYMKKVFVPKKVIEHFKSGLQKIIPDSKNIFINLSDEASGQIKAQIGLKTRGKYLRAHKTDNNLMRSLHKAQGAIIKQFKKRKVRP